MKRFTFRLKHLLGLREQEEELAKLRLGQATRRCDELRLEIIETGKQLRELAFSGFDPASLHMREAYQKRLTAQRKRLEEDLVKAQEVREEALHAYNLTRQKAEILRKLRDRQWDEYRLDTIRQEDSNLDDIVQSRRSNSNDPISGVIVTPLDSSRNVREAS